MISAPCTEAEISEARSTQDAHRRGAQQERGPDARLRLCRSRLHGTRALPFLEAVIALRKGRRLRRERTRCLRSRFNCCVSAGNGQANLDSAGFCARYGNLATHRRVPVRLEGELILTRIQTKGLTVER